MYRSEIGTRRSLLTLLAHHRRDVFHIKYQNRNGSFQFLDALQLSFVCASRLALCGLPCPLLDRHSRLPLTLQRQLANSPSLFVECLKLLYPPHSQSAEEVTKENAIDAESKAEKARRVWQLLRDWRTIPGGNEQGTIDNEALTAWVTEARRLARDVDRLGVCDSKIGQLFAIQHSTQWTVQFRLFPSAKLSKMFVPKNSKADLRLGSAICAGFIRRNV